MPTQQEALYVAEDAVSPGRAFDTYEELQRFVDELRDTWWWIERYPMVKRVEVNRADQRITHGSVGGWFPEQGRGQIDMWTGHMQLQLVIHELSHVLVTARTGSKHGHDPVFAREYCNLTALIRGCDAWLELQVAFDRVGIDYCKD